MGDTTNVCCVCGGIIIGFTWLIADYESFISFCVITMIIYAIVNNTNKKKDAERYKHKVREDGHKYSESKKEPDSRRFSLDNYEKITKTHIIKEKFPSKKNFKEGKKSTAKKEELDDFFRYLNNKRWLKKDDYDVGPYLSDRNFELFASIISNTTSTLDIMTNVFDGKLLSEMLWPIRNSGATVRIITRRIRNEEYIKKFMKDYSNISCAYRRNNRIHAKILLRDSRLMIVGSSNLSDASASKTGFFYDANFVTKETSSIHLAQKVFDSVDEVSDKTKSHVNTNFIYSREGVDYLPLCLKEYFEKEKKAITIVMSSGLIDRQVLDRISEWNSLTKINLIVGDNWPTNELSEDKIITFKKLFEISNNPKTNIRVLPKRKNIHAKLYLFEEQKIAVFSSQNLTINSWLSLLESGYILRKKEHFEEILNDIKLLPKSKMDPIEGEFTEVEKPESSWQGSLAQKKISVPWNFAEIDDEQKMYPLKSHKYYKLMVENKIKKTKHSYMSYSSNIEREGKKVEKKSNEELRELNYQKYGKASVTTLRKRFR